MASESDPSGQSRRELGEDDRGALLTAYADRLSATGNTVVYSIFVLTFVFLALVAQNPEGRTLLYCNPQSMWLLYICAVVGNVLWGFLAFMLSAQEQQLLKSFNGTDEFVRAARRARKTRILAIAINLLLFVFVVHMLVEAFGRSTSCGDGELLFMPLPVS